MGCSDWAEVCFICGLSPTPIPPSELYEDSCDGATHLAQKISEHDPSLLDDLDIDGKELEEILREALDSEPRDHPMLYSAEQKWESFQNAMAIGHFYDSEDGDTPHEFAPLGSWLSRRRIPNGVSVETRLVRDSNCGDFDTVVHRTENEGGSGVTETEEREPSRTGSSTEDSDEGGIGNFWISEGCYHYAQAWVDFSSLPKASWRAHDLSFSGELYEIINSRKEGREPCVGTHPEFLYDVIDQTPGEEEEEEYPAGMEQPKETIAAIRRGATPGELHSAIIKDCRCWMFYSPDIWPTPTNDQYEQYTHFASASSTGLGSLSTFPLEILTRCLSGVDSLHSYLALSQSSKSLWNLLTEPTHLNRMLRQMAAHPSNCLFWIRPVNTLTDEDKRANAALATWLPTPESADSTPRCPLDHPTFPYLKFLRECYAPDSMMNRKRLWGQIKQLEMMWRDYRVNGWRVDRFGVPLPPRHIEDQISLPRLS